MKVRIEFDTENAPGWGSACAWTLHEIADELSEMGSSSKLAPGAKIGAALCDSEGNRIGKCEVTD